MYFTDEEKEIIIKIVQKNRYGIVDFIEDNNLVESEVSLKENYTRMFFFNANWSGRSDFGDNGRIEAKDPVKKCKNNYEEKLDVFIRIWVILENINLVHSVDVNVVKVKEVFRHFIHNNSNSGYEIDINTCRAYNNFIDKELMVHKEYLKEFINDKFQTKDEINIKKSFFWTRFVALTSIVLSIASLIYTVASYNRENIVKVKNINEINTQKLESQLKETTQELRAIKTKFEELQKKTIEKK